MGSPVQKAGGKVPFKALKEKMFSFLFDILSSSSRGLLLFNVVRNKDKLPFFYLQLSDEHRKTERKRNYGQLSAPVPSMSCFPAEVLG